jgi:hypothetical protein
MKALEYTSLCPNANLKIKTKQHKDKKVVCMVESIKYITEIT